MSARQFAKRELFDRFFQRQRLYVLNFHIITASDEDGPGDFGTRTPVDLFRRNIEALSKQYRFVDLYAWWTDPALRDTVGHAIAITFDDGHRSVLDLALPILEEFAIPATLFLNTAYWDNDQRLCWSNADGPADTMIGQSGITLGEAVKTARNTADPDAYLAAARSIEDAMRADGSMGRGYISRQEIEGADPDLVRVGLHGHNHDRHVLFDTDWQVANIRKNREILQSLPHYVPMFAFPFGRSIDVDQPALTACRAEGLIPVLHNGGYNVGGEAAVRRIPADNRNAPHLVKSQSPFLHKYDLPSDGGA